MADRFKKASDYIIEDQTLSPKPDLSDIKKSRLMVLRAGLKQRFSQK